MIITTEPQAQAAAAPEGITILICSRCGLQNAMPVCVCGCAAMNRITYVRADLPRAAAAVDELELLLRRVSELTLDEGFSSHYQRGFEQFRDQMTAVLKARLAATPRVEAGLTVEAALAQLKDLTAHRCEISFFTSGQIAITVFANSIIPMGLFRTLKSTLDEAVNDVRAWAKSRAESGDSSE